MSRLRSTGLWAFTLLCFGLMPTQIKAEGSKEFVEFDSANGGSGRWSMIFSSSSHFNPYAFRTILYMYVKAGEEVALGSSGLYIFDDNGNADTDGNIYVWPKNSTVDGGIGVNPTFSNALFDCRSDDTGKGRMTTRAQETAGPLPASGGYEPCVFTAPSTGIYPIFFTGNRLDHDFDYPPGSHDNPHIGLDQRSGVSLWDITVRDATTKTPKTGRVWSNVFYGVEDGRVHNGGPHFRTWVRTPDGFEYLVRINQMHGLWWNIFSDNKGAHLPDGTRLYSSVRQDNLINGTAIVVDPEDGGTGDVITNKLFINPPDNEIFEDTVNGLGAEGFSDTPVLDIPSINGYNFDGTAGGGSEGHTISGLGQFNYNAPANIAGNQLLIVIDVNKDGVFDGNGDRLILGTFNFGANSIDYDGNDGLGNVIPDGEYTAKLYILRGEIHFPKLDVESMSGITIERLSLSSAPRVRVAYYNDINPFSGEALTDGVSQSLISEDTGPFPSTFHGWANGTGDQDLIDTYTFFPQEILSTTFTKGTVPSVDLQKTVNAVSKTENPFEYETTMLYVIENTGSEALDNVFLQDDFLAQNTKVTAIGAVSTEFVIRGNGGDCSSFNSATNFLRSNAQLPLRNSSGGNCTIPVGSTLSVTVKARFTLDPLVTSRILNSAVVTADDTGNDIVQDTSDGDGNSNADSNSTGTPVGGPNDNDSNPSLAVVPSLHVTKAITSIVNLNENGRYEVTYRFRFENTGTENLISLNLLDVPNSNFNEAHVSRGALTVVESTATTDPVFGSGAQPIASNGLLEPQQYIVVEYVETLRPIDATDPSNIINQAVGKGSHAGVEYTDLSDDGIEPSSTNPGYPGDTGGENDPTPFDAPGIAAVKKLISTSPRDDGHYDITFSGSFVNTGTESLSNIRVVEQPNANLAPAVVSVSDIVITSSDATSNPTVGVYPAIFGGGGDLAPKQAVAFEFTLQVDPTAALDLSDLQNQFQVLADGESNPVSDLSDGGVDPLSNNFGEPGNTGGYDDPVPVGFAGLGVAKAITNTVDLGNGQFDVTYNVKIQNTGSQSLSTINAQDVLAAALTEAKVQHSAATIVQSTATANPSLGTWPNLLSGNGELAPGQFVVLEYVLTIQPALAADPSTMTNQVNATAEVPAQDFAVVSDLSDSGANAIGTNPGEDGDTGTASDPTPFNAPSINLAKRVLSTAHNGDGTFNVVYELIAKNTGGTDLSAIILNDTPSTALTEATVAVISEPAIVGGNATTAPSLGAYPSVLTGGGLMAPAQEVLIQYTLQLRPTDATDPSAMNNQAVVQGTSPSGQNVDDLSDSGVNPVGVNSGQPGDTGGIDDPTPLSLDALGVSKTVVSSTPRGNGEFDVVYRVTVKNLGSRALNNILLDDEPSANLDAATFGSVDPVIFASTAAADPVTATYPSLLGGGGVLLPGQEISVDYTLFVRPSAATDPSLINNSARGVAQVTDNPAIIVIDLSDSGVDPQSNNINAPGDTGGFDDPTPFNASAINVAKRVTSVVYKGDTTFDVTYELAVRNSGGTELTEIALADIPSAPVLEATQSVAVEVAIVSSDATNTPAIGSYPNLLVGNGSMAPGQTVLLNYTLNLSALTVTTAGDLNNQAIVSARDSNAQTVSDLSDSGANPITANSGQPGDTGGFDDPTPVELDAISAAKRVVSSVYNGDGTFTVLYEITVENIGHRQLSNIILQDTPSADLQSAVFGNTATTIVASDNASLPATADWPNLLAGNGVLEPKETITVQYSLSVRPGDATNPMAMTNQALAYGQVTEAAQIIVSDATDSGTNPETPNLGQPGDTGGFDDPTPFLPSAVSSSKRMLSFTHRGEGTFDAVFEVVIQNSGSSTLTDINVTDVPNSQLDQTTSAVSSAVSIVASTADSNPSVGTYPGLLNGGGVLQPKQEITLNYTLEVRPILLADPSGATNQIRVETLDSAGQEIIDLSDAGADPVSSNPTDPADTTGFDDPSLTRLYAIGVTKEVASTSYNGDGTFELVYEVTMQNLGNVALNDLELTDQPNSNLAAATLASGAVSVVAAKSDANQNGDIGSYPSLYTGGGELLPGQKSTVTFALTLDPALAADASSLLNQVAGTARTVFDAGVQVSDLSDSGSVPASVNAGADGDTGGSNDPTPVTLSALDLQKRVSNAQPTVNPFEYQADFTFTLRNFGTENALAPRLSDDFLTNSKVTAINSVTTLSVSGSNCNSFDGGADFLRNSNAVALGGGCVLPAGGAAVELVVRAVFEYDPTITTEILNSATLLADVNGVVVSDVSDGDGNANADTNETGYPVGSEGDDGANPVRVPVGAIHLSKYIESQVDNGDGTYDVKWNFVIRNTGTERLNTINLIDDPNSNMQEAHVALIRNRNIVSSDATTNPGFGTIDWQNNNNVIFVGSGGLLDPGQTIVAQYGMRLDPAAATDPSAMNNSATVGAGINGLPGVRISDVSDSGIDPLTSNPTAPGDTGGFDDPTPFAVDRIALVKTLESLTNNGDGTFTASYRVLAENIGSSQLSNIVITDQPSADLALATVSVGTDTGLAGSTASANPALGSYPTLTTGGGQLLPGQTIAYTYALILKPELANDPAALSNQAVVSADGVAGNVSDLSDSGTDTRSSNPNQPGDTGGFDDPVPLTIDALAVSKYVSNTVYNQDGTFDVSYRVTMKNIGSSKHDRLILVDTPSAALDSAIVARSATFIIENTNATSGAPTVGTHPNLLNGGGDLLSGEHITVEYTLTIRPSDSLNVDDLSNSARGEVELLRNGVFFGNISDVSDSGVDPSSTNPGAPGDTGGSDDPTIHTVSAISASKSISSVVYNGDTTFDVTYRISVINPSSLSLSQVTLLDTPSNALSSATLSVVNQPSIVASTATLNPSAGSYPNLLTGGGNLLTGESLSLEYTLNVRPLDSSDASLTAMLNQAQVSAVDSAGTTVSDLTDFGTDPYDTNTGYDIASTQGYDDPTPVVLNAVSSAKSVTNIVNNGNGTFDVTYVIELLNVGNTLLDHFVLVDTPNADLQSAIVDRASPSIILNDNLEDPTIGAHPNLFNGRGDLAPGQKMQVQYVLTLRPADSTNPTNMLNQAEITNEVLLDGGTVVVNVSDLSDSGTDASVNNAGAPNDTGGFDDPTPVRLVDLDLQKESGFFADTSNGLEYAGFFRYTLKNNGSDPLSNLSLADDFLGSNAKIASVLAVNTIQVNNSGSVNCDSFVAGNDFMYNGTPVAITGPNCVLAAGDTVEVVVQVVFTIDTTNNDRILNSATAFAADSDGAAVSDVSDGDGDPVNDLNGTGFPVGGPNNNDSNPNEVQLPAIGAVKRLANLVNNNDGTFDATYRVAVSNIGSVTLNTVTLIDQPSDNLNLATISVVSDVSQSGGTPVTLGSYPNLVTDGSLAPAEDINLVYTLRINPSRANDSSLLDNQVLASAVPVIGGEVSDLSDSGTDVGTTNPGAPGDTGTEDDPTPFIVPSIGAAKTISSSSPPVANLDGSFNVTYELVVQNTGTVDLSNIRFTDQPNSDHNAATVSVVNDVAIDSSTAGTNPSVGNYPQLLTGGGSLAPGEQVVVSYVLRLNPSLASNATNIENRAQAFADVVGGGNVEDFSDSGSDPTGTNQGASGDTGGSDDPTPFSAASVALQKRLESLSATGNENEFTARFRYELFNSGTTSLTNMSLADNFLNDNSKVTAVSSVSTVSVNAIVTAFTCTDFNVSSNFLRSATPVLITTNTGAACEIPASQGVVVVVDAVFTINPATTLPNVIENSARGRGEDSKGLAVTDVSDGDGNSNTDTEGTGFPAGGPNNNDSNPTLVEVPQINVAKAVVGGTDNGDGSFDIIYQIITQNTGTQTLADVSLVDAPNANLSPASSLLVAASITGSSATTNPSLGSYPNLYSGGVLEAGQWVAIEYTLSVIPANSPDASAMANQATATGKELGLLGGVIATDVSDSGVDPASTNPDAQGDTGTSDDPTPLILPAIDLAKTVESINATATPFKYAARFNFVLSNVGSVTVGNLQIQDNLLSEANVVSVSRVETVSIASTGASSCNVFQASSGFMNSNTAIDVFGTNCNLQPSESVTVVVDATFTMDPAVDTRVLNTATAFATGTQGVRVEDVSDGDADAANDVNGTGFPAGGPANNASNPTLVIAVALDFGDAPSSYGTNAADNGAQHGISPNLYLGSILPDADSGTNASTGADADDLNGDDEDGIAIDDPLRAFEISNADAGFIKRWLVNTTNNSGADAHLYGWIDFDRSGTFDTNELATTVVADGQTEAELVWTVPSDVNAGLSYARFRITSEDLVNKLGVNPFNQQAVDGEVEDYQFEIRDFGNPVAGCTKEAYQVRGNPGGNYRFVKFDFSNRPITETAIQFGSDTLWDLSTSEIVNAIGFNKRDGFIYAAYQQSRLVDPIKVVRIDPTSGRYQVLGEVRDSAGQTFNLNYFSGDVSVDGNTLYWSTADSSHLLAIDLATYEATQINISESFSGADTAVNPSNGNLYHVGGLNNTDRKRLFIIDPNTGSLTKQVLSATLPGDSGGAVFDAEGRFLYSLVNNNGSGNFEIFRIDVGTGSVSSIGTGSPNVEFNDATGCLGVSDIRVAKAVQTTDNGDGTITANYTVNVRNTGTETLNNLTVIDTANSHLQQATLSASAVTSSSSVTLGTYPNLVVDGSLTAGAQITVNFSLQVQASLADDPSLLENSVTAQGFDANLIPVVDVSDSGTSPTGTNPGAAGDTGAENDPTPLDQADINLAKAISSVVSNGDGSVTVVYSLRVLNTGTEALSSLVLTDQPNAQLQAATVSVSAVSIDGGSAAANVTAGTFPNLITAGSLAPADDVLLSFSSVIRPNDASDPSALENQAFVTATDGTNSVQDLSDNGIDPVGDNGVGGVDDPTPLANSAINVAKALVNTVDNGDGSYLLSYELVLRNTGTTPLSAITLVDSPNSDLQSATTASSTVSATGGTVGVYPNLITDANLNPGEEINVDYRLTVTPALATDPSQLLNQATVTGFDGAVTVQDISDNGADPIGDNGAGGTDDPTPFSASAIGVAKLVSGFVNNADGSFNVEYSVVVRNTGSTTLTSLDVLDQPNVNLDQASQAVVSDTSLSSATSGSSVTAGTYPQLISAGSLLPGESVTATYTLRVQPSAAADASTLLNQVLARGNDGTETVTDLSDNGVSTLGDNGEGTSNDATPFIAPAINVAKEIRLVNPLGDGSFDVSYRLQLRNTGSVALSAVSLEDLPSADLLAATEAVAVNVSLGVATEGSNLTAGSYPNLITSGSLQAGESIAVNYILRVRPALASDPSALTNQARAEGSNGATTVSDLSDNGASAIGDNGDGGSDDPTPFSAASIDLQKRITNISATANPFEYQADFSFEFTNTGTQQLSAPALRDNFLGDNIKVVSIAAVNTLSVTGTGSAVACNSFNAGAAFMSNSTAVPIGGASCELAAGDSVTVIVQAAFVIDPASTALIENSAVVEALDANNVVVSDTSDGDGDAGADLNNTGFPAAGPDTNASNPSPLPLPAIHLSKAIATVGNNGDGTFNVRYVVNVQNTGTTDLTNLVLLDQPNSNLVSATDSVVSDVAIIGGSGSATVSAYPNLVTAGNLSVGQNIELAYTLLLRPSSAADQSAINNQVLATATDINGVDVSDLSDSGTDPLSINAGAVGHVDGEDDPTPFTAASINVAKTIASTVSNGDGSFDVSYRAIVVNGGGVSLSPVQVYDQPAGDLVEATESVVANVVLEPASLGSSLTAGSYPDLITAGSLLPSESVVIRYTLRIRPSAATDPSQLENRILAAGRDAANQLAVDFSDSGTDPFGTNPGEPGDTGGNEDPTPFGVDRIDLQKRLVSIAGTNNPFEYQADFRFVLSNQGSTTLSNLSLVDDFLGSNTRVSSISSVSTRSVNSTGSAICNSFDSGNGFIRSAASAALSGLNCELAAGDTVTVVVRTVFVIDSASTDNLLNSATVSATNPAAAVVSDVSDGDGDSAQDLNGTGFPAGGPNDNSANPTPIPLSAISLVKTIDGITDNNDGSYDVRYVLRVHNIGSEDLNSVQLVDQPSTDLQDATVQVVSDVSVSVGSAGSNLSSASYPQIATDGSLLADEFVDIEYTLRIRPANASNSAALQNSAVAAARTVTGALIFDLSDSGTDTQGTNPAAAGDTGGEDDPTPFELPAIKLAKAISSVVDNNDGSYQVTYRLVARNAGTVSLTGITLVDSPSVDLQAATLSQSAVNLESGSATVGAYPNLVTDASLAASETFVVNYTLVLRPSLASDASNLLNQATLSGTDGVNTVSDLSDNGTNPETNNGEGGTDDPTPFAARRLNVAKAIASVVDNADGSYEVAYTVVVRNTGTVDLSSLVLLDEPNSNLVQATESVLADVVLGSATAGSTQTAGSYPNLITDGALKAGESVSLSYTLVLRPSSATNPAQLDNQVRATANDGQVSQTIIDLSDSGTDPESTNPGAAGDTGGSDDPTPFNTSAINVAKYVSLAGYNDDGTSDVTYTVTVTNTGTAPLSNLSLIDQPNADLAAATVSVVEDVTADSSGQLIGSYPNLVTGGNLLPGESVTVRYVLLIQPIAANDPSNLFNQALAQASDGAATVSDLSDNGESVTGNNGEGGV